MTSHFELDNIEAALEDFKNGQFLLVVDDLDRENEGDLIIAGSKVTTAQMAFLIQHSRCAILMSLSVMLLFKKLMSAALT